MVLPWEHAAISELPPREAIADPRPEPWNPNRPEQRFGRIRFFWPFYARVRAREARKEDKSLSGC
jgi:hypothetical protein